MPDKINIGGVPIQVVTEEEAEQVDFVVCGAAIIHRPHTPKRPAKICMGCAVARADAGKLN